MIVFEADTSTVTALILSTVRSPACARRLPLALVLQRQAYSHPWYRVYQCSSQLGRPTIRIHCISDTSMAPQVGNTTLHFAPVNKLTCLRGPYYRVRRHVTLRLLRTTNLDLSDCGYCRLPGDFWQLLPSRYLGPDSPLIALHCPPSSMCDECHQGSTPAESSCCPCFLGVDTNGSLYPLHWRLALLAIFHASP